MNRIYIARYKQLVESFLIPLFRCFSNMSYLVSSVLWYALLPWPLLSSCYHWSNNGHLNLLSSISILSSQVSFLLPWPLKLPYYSSNISPLYQKFQIVHHGRFFIIFLQSIFPTSSLTTSHHALLLSIPNLKKVHLS